MKICKECGIEKELEKFRPLANYKYRSNQCKECRNKKLRTGKPNTGRFQKGIVPLTSFKKGRVSEKKGIYWGNSRSTRQNGVWKIAVKERDGFKCQKCGTLENLTVHHIKSWKEYPRLRFEISNGLTLCNVCHGKEEGPLNANNGINTRFKKGHKFFSRKK